MVGNAAKVELRWPPALTGELQSANASEGYLSLDSKSNVPSLHLAKEPHTEMAAASSPPATHLQEAVPRHPHTTESCTS